MSSPTIDLTGLDRAAVLAALYNASKPQGMGFLHFDPTPMSVDEARGLLAQGSYFDYLKGRVMKIDLSGETLDPWLYDRDNGAGAAEQAIDSLRGTGDANSVLIRSQHATGTQASVDDVLDRLDEGDENEISEEGGIPTFRLGISEFEEQLRPLAEEARRNTRSPLD